MKKISAILLTLLICLSSANCFSQEPVKLPDDPRVKSGKLANGLSYCIIKNQAQKGSADFCIAQKVGSALEKNGMEGSFKLVEQLAVKGTRNFEGSTITNYLHSIGLKNSDILFNTGRDKITYLIKNVPVAKANTVDSSLLILYNWMSSINMDEDDMSAEFPILKSKVLDSWDAETRLNHNELKELYPDSPYTHILNPDNVDNMRRLSSKELRTFYYQWFRPDQQCVIIVGDIDPSKLETQVKSTFATIPKPLKEERRIYYKPADFEGIKSVILKDKEYGKTTVSISFLKEPLPAKYKTSNLPFIQEFMNEVISRLLMERIKEGIVQQNLPVTDLNILSGKFMEIEKSSAFTISFQTLPNTVYASLSFISGEINKMGKYGFTGQEFNRSVEIYWRRLEKLYDNRAEAANDIYLKRALDYFYDGYSLASIELKFEIMKEVLFSLRPADLNKYAKALLDQRDNIVISCKMPDVKEIEPLSKERILSSYAEALDKGPSAYHNIPAVKWPEEYSLAPASIVTQEEDPITGAFIMLLSNGATVVYKNVTGSKDTVSVKAVSKGGFSLMKGVTFGNRDFFNEALNIGGLGTVSQANMKGLLDYYHMDIYARLNQNTEEISGYAVSENLEKLFQAINLEMTQRRSDNAAFEILKKQWAFNIVYHSISPAETFKDTVYYYNNSNKNYVKPLTESQIEKYNYKDIQTEFNERFSNAADFCFIFTGKADLEKFKEYAVKYIGGIPGNQSERENWIVVPNYLAKGKVEKEFLFNMAVPRTYLSFNLSCGKEANIKNEVLCEMTHNLIERICADKLGSRSANYKVYTTLEHYPEDIFVASSSFETDSASAPEIKKVITDNLTDIAENGISKKEFDSLSGTVESRFSAAQEGNSFWLNMLERRYIGGLDFYDNFSSVLNGITQAEFASFISDLLDGNRISVVMYGTHRDIQTEKLFEENSFIKDYFDVN